MHTERAYAEEKAYSRGADSFINSTVAIKRCLRIICLKAGQFKQVLVLAKLHLC
jgi:hypothetical protein